MRKYFVGSIILIFVGMLLLTLGVGIGFAWFGIAGALLSFMGLMLYLVDRYPAKSILKNISIGTPMVVAGIITLGLVSYALTDEETKQRLAQERELERQLEIQKQMAELEKQKSTTFEEMSFSEKESYIKDFVFNYKGKDNAGPTLEEAVETLLLIVYPNEDILKNPTTSVSFAVSPDHRQEDSDRYWRAGLEIETYRETAYLEWVVDTKTNTLVADNTAAKDVLTILDETDK